VFVSSHLISEMARTAEPLVVIGAGRLLADTTVAELSARSTSLEDAFFDLTAGSAEFGTPRNRSLRSRFRGDPPILGAAPRETL
jgi:ABC-2 type transport system ATP-binding protein